MDQVFSHHNWVPPALTVPKKYAPILVKNKRVEVGRAESSLKVLLIRLLFTSVPCFTPVSEASLHPLKPRTQLTYRSPDKGSWGIPLSQRASCRVRLFLTEDLKTILQVSRPVHWLLRDPKAAPCGMDPGLSTSLSNLSKLEVRAVPQLLLTLQRENNYFSNYLKGRDRWVLQVGFTSPRQQAFFSSFCSAVAALWGPGKSE